MRKDALKLFGVLLLHLLPQLCHHTQLTAATCNIALHDNIHHPFGPEFCTQENISLRHACLIWLYQGLHLLKDF